MADTAVQAEQPKHPDLIARVLATALISTLIGALVAKLFGPKAGFAVFVVTAAAHEVLDAPLARTLSGLGV